MGGSRAKKTKLLLLPVTQELQLVIIPIELPQASIKFQSLQIKFEETIFKSFCVLIYGKFIKCRGRKHTNFTIARNGK